MWLLALLMIPVNKIAYDSLNEKDKRHVARLGNSYCKSAPVYDDKPIVKRLNQAFWYK